jgi:hypothetical protein
MTVGQRLQIVLIELAAQPPVNSSAQLESLEEAVRHHGVALAIHRVGTSNDIVPVIEAPKAACAEAINILASPMFNASHRAGLVVEVGTDERLRDNEMRPTPWVCDTNHDSRDFRRGSASRDD